MSKQEMERTTGVRLLFVASVVTTGILYLLVVPRLYFASELDRVVIFVMVGWIPYTLLFYCLGRLGTTPTGMPKMRPADVGVALFVVAFLVSLGFDRWGVTPERVPEAHVIQLLAILVGLGLFGWGIGRRGAAIEELVSDTDT